MEVIKITPRKKETCEKVTISFRLEPKRIKLLNELGHKLTLSNDKKTNVKTAMVRLLNEGLDSLVKKGEVTESKWT